MSIWAVIDMDRHIGLLERLLNSRIESVIEEDCGADGIRCCPHNIIRHIAAGIFHNAGHDPDRRHLSTYLYCHSTHPERYYKSIEFLETLSKQMFAVKLEELLAQEAFLKSRE